jgi:hypothetical protein
MLRPRMELGWLRYLYRYFLYMEQPLVRLHNCGHILKLQYKTLMEVAYSKGLKPGLKLIAYNIGCQSCWL